MGRAELEIVLTAASVSALDFDLNGSASSDNARVLEDDRGIWYVYYQERGNGHDEQHFLSEDETLGLFMLSKLMLAKGS